MGQAHRSAATTLTNGSPVSRHPMLPSSRCSPPARLELGHYPTAVPVGHPWPTSAVAQARHRPFGARRRVCSFDDACSARTPRAGWLAPGPRSSPGTTVRRLAAARCLHAALDGSRARAGTGPLWGRETISTRDGRNTAGTRECRTGPLRTGTCRLLPSRPDPGIVADSPTHLSLVRPHRRFACPSSRGGTRCVMRSARGSPVELRRSRSVVSVAERGPVAALIRGSLCAPRSARPSHQEQ